ncbi:MAG: AAA family ATPase [Vampirovibrio sp.]|nr:AAA family ATPase [Vampirovibrio sp.]
MIYISKITIKNFRNFENINIDFTEKSPIVLVGETQSGKSNIIHALRLILDETLTQDELQITKNDFYHEGKEILISIEITSDLDHPLSVMLLECFKETKGNTVVGNIKFHAKMNETEKKIDQGYTIDRQPTDEWKSRLSGEFRECFQLGFLDALRDVKAELNNKLRSPLRYALEKLNQEPKDFKEATTALNAVVKNTKGLGDVEEKVNERTNKLTGERHRLNYTLEAQSLDFSKMLKELQLVFGAKQFTLEEASLGTNNALFLSLKALSFTDENFRKPRRHQKNNCLKPFTWLAIEEPEAHLHPQLQRQVFTQLQEYSKDTLFSTIVSTHSPHLVSIVPIQDIVMLKRNRKGASEAKQIKKDTFSEPLDLFKLQSYLQVTRAEMLFASGVILVEGIAEKLLLQAWFPELDGLGISICSVEGTHFELYTRFLDAFSIPWVVITDGDENSSSEITNSFAKTYQDDENVFIGKVTLEYELWQFLSYKAFISEKITTLHPKAGNNYVKELNDSIQAISTTENATKHPFKLAWADCSNLQKGSLAQELAYEIQKCPFEYGAPDYIKKAVDRIKELVQKND